MEVFITELFPSPAKSTPMRGTRSPCCARAASGHAAVLPSPAMNSRRRIRHLPKPLDPLLSCDDGLKLDCGASGKYKVPGAMALGPPEWAFPRDPIPARDDSVGELHAHHFLEHLDPEMAIRFLREVERVLIPERGVFSFTVPYFGTVLAAQDLSHKSPWTEETFRNLFSNDTYEHHGSWRLNVRFLADA
jgi:hypothetical protein